MPLSLIAAISRNSCIGKDGVLPWHIPDDLRRFRDLTTEKVVLMGRKTWESLPEKFRPLPNRLNIVITRQETYELPVGVERYTTIQEALAAHQGEEVVSIGGAEIYQQTIALADTLYITHVHTFIPDGTAFFPRIDTEKWREVERDDRESYSFVTYRRNEGVGRT